MIKNYALKTLLLLCCLYGQLRAQDIHFEWVRSIGGIHDELGHAIAVDDSGNVFTTGYFRETADFNIGSSPERLTSASDADVFITKHDKNGVLKWAKRYGGTRNDEGNSIVADAAGNIYVTGRFVEEMDFGSVKLQSNGEEDIFIAKLDTDGNCIWAKNIGNEGDQTATSIALDPSGNNLYVVGSLMKGDVDMNPGGSPQIIGGECMFILKLKNNGDFVWVKRIASDKGYIDLANSLDAISVSADNHLHIVGQFWGTVDFDPEVSGQNLTSQVAANNFEDAFVLKLDSLGRFVWVKALSGTGRNYVTGVANDAQGNVYYTGSFDGTADFDPGTGNAPLSTAAIYVFATYISKLDINGNYVWARQVGGQSSVMSRGQKITVDENDHIYTTGFYKNKIDFNPSTAPADTFYLSGESQSTGEAFVLKLDENGAFGWAKAIARGTSSSVAGSRTGIGITTDRKGSVYTVGGFQGSTDFDPDDTKSSVITWEGHNHDVFIHKMSCAGGESAITLTLCEPFVWRENVYAESGIYTEVLTSALGCDSIITLDLTIYTLEEPIINVDSFQLSTLQTYDYYQWLLNDTPIFGATNRTYRVLENGFYKVAVENNNGCKDTSEYYEVTNIDVSGIRNSGPGFQVKIFPNPSYHELHISSPVWISLELLSIDGKLIKNYENPKHISIIDLTPGLYMLRIRTKDKQLIKTEKLIKMINRA